ncbi:MAG TPA: NHLP family bacteriocin export ABC transporter peptidase/permease/ATPase subunit [Thermoanaerobaculia bacterium]|jgi:NHLM bacteriocin system ABC transporter peptidase/ATP-binding protein|nr:NHLP family bacteriocin export ABC transporter peptidase/permease/ATPase subunit [Thermoanaerobaculia bacterium]
MLFLASLLEKFRRRSQPAERPQGRVRTPTILQMEAVECGAAALAIVLAHYGRWVPLEELRVACGVSRDGSKASNMVKAARTYGLEAKGFKREPQSLRAVRPPMILHWNFNHFVVLEGIRKGRVHLNDPGTGPRVVTEEELDQAFTGVVLTFSAGPDFVKRGDPPSLVPALKSRLTGTKAALVFVLLAGLALAIPGMVVPVFSKVFLDSVLLEGHREWLPPLLLAMGCAAVLLGALTWLQQSYLLRLETRLAVGGSSRFLWHVLRLPSEFFSQRFAGDISSRVAINDRVAQLLSRDLATNGLGAVMIVFFAVLLFQYDVVLTLVGIGVVSLNVAALKYISRRRVDGNRRLVQDQGKLLGTAIGGLQTIETLKATGGESDLFARWAGFQAKVVNGRQELERYTQILDTVPGLLSALNSALILGIGGVRVMNGSLSVGGLVAYQLLMAAFIAPVTRLVSLGSKLQTVEGDMNRLDDVLRYRVAPGAAAGLDDEVPAAGETVKLAGSLELRNVSFGYSRLDPPLVEGLNLMLRPGSRVALVGGSGSGKSTIARLVTGLYQPWEGEILFDGRPRSAISPAVLASSLATVDQNIFLFEGTVRENLTLWDPTVPLAEVVAAAKDASIHEDVAARPGGYGSPVEEGGANWSGGQRQRLEIARALVGRPSILVLDEATSALDPSTENQIDERLRRRGCTCLLVAHRLSTIRDADEILVLDHGKVVQRGTHDQLRAVEGPYSRLISTE